MIEEEKNGHMAAVVKASPKLTEYIQKKKQIGICPALCVLCQCKVVFP